MPKVPCESQKRKAVFLVRKKRLVGRTAWVKVLRQRCIARVEIRIENELPQRMHAAIQTEDKDLEHFFRPKIQPQCRVHTLFSPFASFSGRIPSIGRNTRSSHEMESRQIDIEILGSNRLLASRLCTSEPTTSRQM